MREKQSPKAEKIWLSIYPRNFGSHVTVRPSVQGVSNQSGSLHFLADIERPGCGQLTAVKKQDIR